LKRADCNDLDRNIAVARVMLSVLALASWYIDPANGGWFFIDQSSLIILTLHLIYSLTTFFLTGRGIAAWLLPRICIILDISFAAGITLLTEGPTSPSWLFFLFAIIVVDSRTSFRSTVTVTICSALVYLGLLAALIPGPRNEYIMRSAYLAIIGYLVGFIGAQRARFESRVRELEAASARHSIARALHDGFVQALAGVNLRLETCRTLLQTGRHDEALGQITDLQRGVTREYDEVRAYIRSLAAVEHWPEQRNRPFALETLFELTANFAGRASQIEQILQIVLEGVRNTRQHGMAACAAVNISATDRLIRIAIDDDGVGFRDAEHPPWAIASRVVECGGRLTIGDAERRGAHLEIEMPAT
jgi:signal transduction histidine kinase